MTRTVSGSRVGVILAALNSRWHKAALLTFLVIVVAHWAEHLLQAMQIYLLGWSRHEAGGGLGLIFPVLVHSELLHYGYALIMLLGFIMLRRGFTGRSHTWWMVALWIQVWHHFEHFLLLAQAWTGANLFGHDVPVSLIQLLIPRVELHLLYNAIVFAPMVVAMVLHNRPNTVERRQLHCTCAHRPARELQTLG